MPRRRRPAGRHRVRVQPALGTRSTSKGVPYFRIVLDPGHGGRPEGADARGGAHWDPVAKRFWNPYRFGCAYRSGKKRYTEHEIVLNLARRVEKLLTLTETAVGWKRFERLLKRFGRPIKGKAFPQARIFCELTRRHSYKTHPKRRDKHVNRYFRLFDSPETFPATLKTPVHPGRASCIASWAPCLVLCLHINGCGTKTVRGMHCLFAPDHGVFEEARQVILGKKRRMNGRARRVKGRWRFHDSSRTKRGWMFNDTWTYFTGCGSVPNGRTQDRSVNVSQRWNQVTWAYSDPKIVQRSDLKKAFVGPFWDRERSRYERCRRGWGPEGYGGDNLYAGQELLRFIRWSLWRHYEDWGHSFGKGEHQPVQLMGHHHLPTAADWALPIYSNAVVAYLELGYLSNWKDRWLFDNRMNQYAEGLAAGIYSLLQGIRPFASMSVPSPRGGPVQWSRYKTKGGYYFEEALRGPSAVVQTKRKGIRKGE